MHMGVRRAWEVILRCVGCAHVWRGASRALYAYALTVYRLKACRWVEDRYVYMYAYAEQSCIYMVRKVCTAYCACVWMCVSRKAVCVFVFVHLCAHVPFKCTCVCTCTHVHIPVFICVLRRPVEEHE